MESPVRGRALGLRTDDGLAEPAGHVGVALGDATGVVRHECQLDAVVTDIDVRVVAFLLGDLGHAIDEIHGLNETGKGPVADQLVLLESPFRQLAEDVAELRLRESLPDGIHGNDLGMVDGMRDGGMAGCLVSQLDGELGYGE